MSEIKPTAAQANQHGAICPIDYGRVAQTDGWLVCNACKTQFPIIDGVPVLINDANSVFQIGVYVSDSGYGAASSYGGLLDRTSGLSRLYRTLIRKMIEA